MRTLRPQRLRPSDTVGMEEQLLALFRAIIFDPVLAVAAEASAQVDYEIKNATDTPLARAIRSGRVQYHDGAFFGEFDAAIAKEIRRMGGAWDKRRAIYTLAVGDTPTWVRAEAAVYELRAKATHEKIKSVLDGILQDLDARLDARPVRAGETVRKVDQGWRTASKELETMPELSVDSQDRLSAKYTESLRPPIKDFVREQVSALRESVEDNAQQGYRFDHLVSRIKHRYGVSENKARFLARNETSRFMSQYRAQRFGEVGVRRYRWDGTMDARERRDHRDLQGQIFFYDQPPVVNKATGKRANPGEDFNCRCIDVPILDPVTIGS